MSSSLTPGCARIGKPRRVRACLRTLLPLAMLLDASTADASAASLRTCSAIEADPDRLACYDRLAGRGQPASSAAEASATNGESAPIEIAEAPDEAPQASDLERRWELRPDLRQGTFKVVPYRPIYALIHASSEINDQPSSPTRPLEGDDVELDAVEATLQLSFKSKIVEDALGLGTDVWFGYTQQSHWQAANRRYSSPFRETNYQPEAIVVQPVNYTVGGVTLRFLGASLTHESNGRGGALSRSWNRVIGNVAFDSGPWSLELRPWARVFDRPGERDDNPDIQDYIGRGEAVATWRHNGHVVTFTGRHTLRDGDRSRGSVRLDWAFPLAGSLNGHLQLFSGYGESLIDYNHRQTTLGFGVSFFD